jgi:glycosyltransferase involved in cell wall biosynthesis
MQESDAFVLFSHSENQPVVLLEAQCVGLPCIGTRVGGIADIITDGQNGYLIPAGDEEELAAAMGRVVSRRNSFDRKQIATRAAARYGEEAVSRALEEVYRLSTAAHA